MKSKFLYGKEQNGENVAYRPAKNTKGAFLGNGVLRLGKGKEWSDLINSLDPSTSGSINVNDVPMAMRPEAICGTDVEAVQRKTAAVLETGIPHRILQRLTEMDFDAILTTNYTYEIEQAISGGIWTEKARRKAHTTLCEKHSHDHHNTYKCNLVRDKNGRDIPVFHIHGEKDRKHSLVLSYYSYANMVYHLIEMNKDRKNTYEEHQDQGTALECHGWLDYFLLGDVYAIGFGFDTSEFDIWWAIERKSRERAIHGKLHAFMIDPKQDIAKTVMFKSMDVEEHFIQVNEKEYVEAYKKMLTELEELLGGREYL